MTLFLLTLLARLVLCLILGACLYVLGSAALRAHRRGLERVREAERREAHRARQRARYLSTRGAA